MSAASTSATISDRDRQRSALLPRVSIRVLVRPGAYAGNFNGNLNVQSGYSYDYNISTCVAGHCISDARLKHHIEPLASSLDRLLRLHGVTFDWNDPERTGRSKERQTGFIAQEVEKVFPSWVDADQDGHKGIVLPPLEMAALQVESIRALHAENEDLRTRVKALENGSPMKAGGLGLGGSNIGLLAVAAAIVFAAKRRGASSAA